MQNIPEKNKQTDPEYALYAKYAEYIQYALYAEYNQDTLCA